MDGEGREIKERSRLPEILVVPREKTPTGAAARGNPGDAPVLASSRELAEDRMFHCLRKGPLSSHRHRDWPSGEASLSDLSISLHHPKGTVPLGLRFISIQKETVRGQSRP